MDTDPFLDRLREVDQACVELQGMLEHLREAAAEVRRMRARGARVSSIVASGPAAPARREVRRSWSRLNEALHAHRAQIVKNMVDVEGMSIADVARLTGNARQLTSRLYHAAGSSGWTAPSLD